MQITRQSSEGLKHVYRVVIEASDLASALESELKELGAKVRIPGFRPGHVPINVLKQRYGASVREDVLRGVISEATRKVLEDGALRPAFQPEVKVDDYKEGESLTFTLAIESIPEVPELDFASVSLERETFEVPEAEVDDALQRLAKESPKHAPLPAGHAAKEGEVVVMDFEGKVGGVPFPGGKAERFSIELGSGRLIPGFEDQLIGVKAGEEREVGVVFPVDYFNKELAGKEALFAVKAHEVNALETPEINDEFAKERGFESLSALREAVRSMLTRTYDQIVRARLKKRLFDALDALCAYPLPDKMVEMEFDAIWGQLQAARRQAGPDEDIYEGKNEAEVRAEYRALAERRVRLGILLAELGRRQKLEATRDELSKAIVEQARRFPGQEQQVYDYYRKQPARLDELRGPILEDKAVDWVLTQVTLRDKRVDVAALNEDAMLAEVDDSADDTEPQPKKSPPKEAKKGPSAAPKKKSASGKKKSEA